MMKRKTTKWCVGLLALMMFGGFTAQGKEARLPNVVLILNDDMGYADLGCFGAPKNKTPRIDRMAKAGRRFTRFYVASSVCSPSRAALLPGCYPGRVGVSGVFFPNHGSHGLAPERFTIAELLKSVGYKTLAAGKWHLGDEPKFLPTNQGFDSFYGVPYSNDMYPAKNMKYADDCLFREGITPQGLEEAFAQATDGKQPKGMKNKVPLMRDEVCIEFPLDQTTITRRLADESIRFIEESAKEDKPWYSERGRMGRTTTTSDRRVTTAAIAAMERVTTQFRQRLCMSKMFPARSTWCACTS